MKIRSNIKSGGASPHVKVFDGRNHNEKLTDDKDGSIESKKNFKKKLRVNKETIRELKESEMENVAGGLNLLSPSYCCTSYYRSCVM